MLGENHALRVEFPDHLDTITSLNNNDTHFATELKEYDNLDKEIRELELAGSPVSDETLHQLKQQRMALKDSLVLRIQQFEG